MTFDRFLPLTSPWFLSWLAVMLPVQAQIIPDATLPVNSSVPAGCTVCTIDGGTVRGSNLFHSFSQFSVPTGGTARFNNGTGITNILTRITGTGVSSIDGIIQANSTANVFLLNPNGIIFGRNAALNIGGSFIATTADAVQFGNQGFYSAVNPDAPALLTIDPSALVFSQLAAQPIINRSIADTNGLQVSQDRSLLLVGGEVQLEGGRLRALGGRVTLGGVAGPGRVALTVAGNDWQLGVANDVVRSNVLLTNGSTINVLAGNGGSINIEAANFSLLDGSTLEAGIDTGLGTPSSQAGTITVNATGQVSLVGSGSRIANQIRQNATGQGGDVQITTGSLELLNGAQISTSTFGRGDGGSVVIAARDQVSLSNNSRIGAGVQTGAIGQGGDVQITTGSLEALGGSQILTNTFGIGNAGNIVIEARDRVLFSGGIASRRTASGAFSSVDANAIGNGGTIQITTGSLDILDGASLITNALGSGDAGSVVIVARNQVLLSGRTEPPRSGGILTFTLGSGQRAGDIRISTPRLQLTNISILNAESAANEGGNIILQLEEALLLRQNSTISASGGSVILLGTADFNINNPTGNGGNITITAPFIVSVLTEDSDITASAFTGNGGQIRITAQGIYGLRFQPQSTPFSDIKADSQFGLDGVVTLNTPDVDPSRDIVALPTELVDTDALIANSCIARRSDKQGSFLVTGAGGLPSLPSDLATVPFPTYELVSSVAEPSEAKIAPKIAEMDGIYHLPSGEMFLGRSCSYSSD